jgi:stearoyl-CoA 9-desaturase NADPH oxidoreductase
MVRVPRILRPVRHLFSPCCRTTTFELINLLWSKALRGRVERIESAGESAATVVIRPSDEWRGTGSGSACASV